MALQFKGGRALHRGDQGQELQKTMEAAELVKQLMNKVQSLRMMGGRDKNLDIALQRARECGDAIANYLGGE